MPRLRFQESQTRPTREIGGRNATGADFGSQVGAATEGFGRSLEQAGAFLKQKEEEDANAWRQRAITQFRLDQTKAFAEGQQGAPEDGVGFTKTFRESYQQQGQALLDTAPTERSRRALENDLLRMESEFVQRGIQFESRARGAKARRDFEDSMSDALNTIRLDPSQRESVEEVLASQIREMPIPASAKAELAKRLGEDIATVEVETIISNADTVEKAEAAIEAIKDERFVDKVPSKTYGKLLRAAERNVHIAEREQQKKQAEADKAKLIASNVRFNELLVGLERGEVSQRDIDLFRANGLADGAQPDTIASQWRQATIARRRMVERNQKKQSSAGKREQKATLKAQQEHLREVASVAKVTLAFLDGEAVDPKGVIEIGDGLKPVKMKDAVNNAFDALTAKWQADGLQGAELAAQQVKFAARLGVIPNQIISHLRMANVSGNPQVAVQGALLYESLKRENPALIPQMPKRDMGRLNQISIQIRNNPTASPTDIVERVDALRNVSSEERKERASRARAVIKDRKTDDVMTEIVDQGWLPGTSAEEIPAAMKLEYETELKKEIVEGDYENAARETARDRMLSRWGVSFDGGKRQLKRDAPSLHYGVPNLSQDENAKWILGQAREELLKGSVGIDADVEVHLDAHTQRSAPDGRPAYTITYRLKDGRLQSDGKVFIPDYAEWLKGAEQRAARKPTKIELDFGDSGAGLTIDQRL